MESTGIAYSRKDKNFVNFTFYLKAIFLKAKNVHN